MGESRDSLAESGRTWRSVVVHIPAGHFDGEQPSGTSLATSSGMSAIPTLSRLPINVSQVAGNNGSAHSNAPDAADSAEPRARGRDFAAALQSAGPRPARKAAINKRPDDRSTGVPLPAAGNPSPPSALPA